MTEFVSTQRLANPVQLNTSINNTTLTNKSISPPNVFPMVSRYAAGR